MILKHNIPEYGVTEFNILSITFDSLPNILFITIFTFLSTLSTLIGFISRPIEEI